MLMKLPSTRGEDAGHLNLKNPNKIADSATFTTAPRSVKPVPTQTRAKPANALSKKEKAQLRRLESVLRKNEGKASLASALALHQINVNRLYRGHENSMKKYGAIWGFSPAYTSRLVRSGEIYLRLSELCQLEGLRKPTSAWQLRPLIAITDPVAQKMAWRNSVKKAIGRKLTAEVVEGCAVRFGGKPKPVQTSRSLMALNLDAVTGLTKKLEKEAKRRKAPLKDTIMQILAEAVGLNRPTQPLAPTDLFDYRKLFPLVLMTGPCSPLVLML